MAIAVQDQAVETPVKLEGKGIGEGLSDKQLGSLLNTQMQAEGAASKLSEGINTGVSERVAEDKVRIGFLRGVINKIRSKTGF